MNAASLDPLAYFIKRDFVLRIIKLLNSNSPICFWFSGSSVCWAFQSRAQNPWWLSSRLDLGYSTNVWWTDSNFPSRNVELPFVPLIWISGTHLAKIQSERKQREENCQWFGKSFMVYVKPVPEKIPHAKKCKYYRLFFLRSIAKFFTQIYMNCFVRS